MSTPRVCVILAGCGVYDGAEVYESVLTLLSLERRGTEVTCAAPDIPQMHVIDHRTGEETGETRNVQAEAARISRGPLKDLVDINASDFDALVIPGGFGVAKNLCNFAVKGADCSVNDQMERILREFADAGKPIGGICITPALLARVFGDGLRVTIGTDADVAEQINRTGAEHVNHQVTEIEIDEQHKIVTTPAYMLGQRIADVAEGIDKLVEKTLEMCR